jgi:hypothetical protein
MKRLVAEAEPLNEARWARIERDLFAGLDGAQPKPRSHRWAFVLAAAAVALVMLGVAWRSQTLPPIAPTPTHLTVGESSLDVAPGTSVHVRGDDEHGIVVSLEKGSVDFEIAPRRGRPPFAIETPHARVEVIGTHFRVTVDPRRTQVDVASGIVSVKTKDSENSVTQGGSWSSDDHPPAPPIPSATASVVPTSSAPIVQAPIPKLPSPRDQFEQAEALERTDPDRAIAQYDRLARGNGPWSDNALFAEARLQADRHKTPEAKQLLEEYLRRYPTGPNAEDARALLSHM